MTKPTKLLRPAKTQIRLVCWFCHEAAQIELQSLIVWGKKLLFLDNSFNQNHMTQRCHTCISPLRVRALAGQLSINAIFYLLKKTHADDNTISYFHCDINILTEILIEESNLLIQWFGENFIKANPDKFQAICIGKKTLFEIGSTLIKWTTSWENLLFIICVQQRCRSAFASAQWDQHLCCSLPI